MDKLIKTTEIIEKKLEKFYELHLNCQINLTAIKEREEFYLKHYYDSIGKKCIFLEQAAKKLELKNIEVLNTRVENIKDRSFDIITARGVSSVKELLKNSFQISKQNTKWVMYKGERLDEELKEALPVIEKRGLNVEKIRIELPITRTYCIISC